MMVFGLMLSIWNVFSGCFSICCLIVVDNMGLMFLRFLCIVVILIAMWVRKLRLVLVFLGVVFC